MFFITCDVVKLSQVIIISDRFDNSFDIKTQVLFFVFGIWHDKSTRCQLTVLPIYSDLFTYFNCQWAKICRTPPVKVTQRRGGTGTPQREASGNALSARSHHPSPAPQLHPLPRRVFVSLAKETGKENALLTAVPIPGPARQNVDTGLVLDAKSEREFKVSFRTK